MANMTFKTCLLPSSNLSTNYTLGKSDQKWIIYGNLTGNATSADKVNNSLTLQFNGTTKGTYNGSSAATINITPAGIGAATSSHTHTTSYINSDTSSTVYVLGATTTGYTSIYRESSVYMTNNVLYGAAWNDYAEYRQGETAEPGRCIVEVGDDTLVLATQRMMPGANIISDTFGFAIGKTDKCKTPIAVSGRVLAYPYESIEEFKKNIGRPVCSGPNGTVSIMTDKEYKEKGYCAIGFISAVPDYEEWSAGNVKVNGRVWIKVI